MTKKIGLLIGIAFMAVLMAACAGKTKSEKDIAKDLSESDLLLAEGLKIENVEITQRKTDKKDKKDLIYADLSGSANGTAYTFSYILEYTYFDKGGWILQSAEPINTKSWHIDEVSDEVALEDSIKVFEDELFNKIDVTESESIITEVFPETGTCQKSVMIKGQGEGFHGTFILDADYIFTSQGWVYDSGSYGVNSLIPEYSMSKEEVEQYVQSIYGFTAEETSVYTDWDNGMETHYVISRESLPYVGVETYVTVNCYFDAYEFSWRISDYQEGTTYYNWDVEGTWYVEGKQKPDEILFPKGFDYRIKCVVTKVDPLTFQVDYEFLNPIIPWSSSDVVGSGTVYVDTSETLDCRHKSMLYNPYNYELYATADIPGFSEVIMFSAENGVSISHFSWGSYERQLTRE